MSVELIVFPDAAALIATHLRTQLDVLGPAVIVVGDVPNPRPGEFVTVQRLGGVKQNLVTDAPLVGIEAWSLTAGGAHDLIQLCRAILNSLPGQMLAGTPVYRVDEAGGPSDFPDPLSTHERFVLTVAVHLRGTTPFSG